MSNLWEKSSYKSPIQFLIDTTIKEYDISQANISVLRDANVLSEEQYLYFLKCPKLEREIAIGKLQGNDSNITAILKNGIANARRMFINYNNIKDSDILSIRNDSITVIGNKSIICTDITDRVHFRLSGYYTSFYHINTIDLLYFYDRVEDREILDVKGLGRAGTELHKEYMLDFLSLLFYTAQVDGIKDAISILESVYNQYINKDMPIEYYREFNSLSKYKLIKNISMISSIYMDNASERDKLYLDISFNENILRYLNSIYASIYFSSK